jgi:ferredoxin
MKVRVDRELCIGAASCVDIAPDVFELDDENRSTVKSSGGASTDEALLREAADTCPMTAVILEDDQGNQTFP